MHEDVESAKVKEMANWSLAALALLATSTLAPAQAATPAGSTSISALIVADTACTSVGVLGHIKGVFGATAETQHHPRVLIASINDPRPSGHPYAEPGLVRRDFCMADAVMTDGSKHRVYYVIEHGLGFAGIGREIDFCVPGFDPWYVHDGDCRTVR